MTLSLSLIRGDSMPPSDIHYVRSKKSIDEYLRSSVQYWTNPELIVLRNSPFVFLKLLQH